MRRLFQRSIIGSLALSLLIGGTVFFHYWEGWAWIDSWLFTVVTISTVGYGNLVPATTVGKLVASFMIIGGISVFTLLGNEIAERLVHRRAMVHGGNPTPDTPAGPKSEATQKPGES